MQILQAVSGVPVSNTRKIASIIFAAALLSGFFVPLSANALITSLTLTDPTGGEEWRGTQNITWTSTDDGSGNNISILLSTDGGSSYSTLVNSILSTLGTYSWDTTQSGAGPLADGNDYRIKIADPVTLLDSSSAADFTDDNTDPITTQTPNFPFDGLDGWYVTVPTITLTCDDSVGGNSGCLAGGTQYRWDGGGWNTYTVPFSPAEGTHTLEWYSEDQAVDALGAHNVEATQSVVYKVDTTVPTVAVTSSTGNGAYNEPDAINVTLTFSENVSSSNTLTVTLNTGGTCSVGILTDTNIGTCTYTVGVSENTSDLTVTSIVPVSGVVEDIAGNNSTLVPTSNIADTSDIVIDTTAPAAFTVGTVVTTGAPVVAGWWNSTNTGVDVTVPVANDASLTGGTIQVQAEADGTYENLGSAYTIIGGDLGGNKTLSFTDAQLEALAGFSDADNVNVRAVITDVAENATTGTESADDFGVDQTAPVVDAGTDKETSVSVTQNATASDAGSSNIATYLWTSHANVNFASAGTEDTDVSATTDGTYTLTLTVIDNAGNSTTDTATFVWDTTDPVLTAVTLVPTPTNDTSPSYTFSVDKAAWLVGNTGTINITGACGAWTPSAAQDGSNTITFTGPLANAMYTDCDITVTDFAGNSNAVALQINDFEVDTVAAVTNTAGITTEDTNTNGKIDTVTVVFDDPVDDSTFVASDFTVGGVTPTAVDTDGGVDDNTIVLVMGTEVDGTEAKTVSYTVGSALDLAGNAIATFSYTSTDAAGPVLISARTITTTSIDAQFSEDLNGATVNAGGSEFTVAGGTYAVSAAVEHVSDDGRVVLTVATMPTDATPSVKFTNVDSFKDLNAVEAVSPVTVTAVDGVAPTLSAVHIASNNVKHPTTLAKESNTVTLTFTSSEAIDPPVVTIGNESAGSVAGVGNDWTATLVMDADDPEGAIAFTINFQDQAVPTPNVGTQVSTTGDASSILYDRTVPSVDAGTTPQYINLAVSSINQNATVTDGGSGVDAAEFQWTQTSGPLGGATATPDNTEDTVLTSTTDGTYTMELYGEDNAGNSATDTMTLVRDTVSPFVKTYSPTTGKVNVPVTAGTATVTFNETIGVLDASGATIVKDSDDSSVGSGAASVSGGNDATAILQLPYVALETGTAYRMNVNPDAVRDTAGNPFILSFANHFTTEADQTPPVVESFTAGTITTTGAVLSATTDENATCRFSDVDEAFGSMTLFDTTGTIAHSTTLVGLTPATTYDFYTRCVDASPAANVMTTSAHVSFTTAPDVDVTPPDAPVITTASATTDADTYPIAGTVANDGGTRTLNLYNGATLVATLSLPAGQTAWSTSVSLTQTSANVFTAYASDGAGNTSAVSNTVTITEATATGDVDDPATPVIDGADETVDADTYNLSGTAGADLPSDDTRVITVYNNGVVVGSLSLPAGETDWSFVSPLNQGTTNTFTAYSTDSSGNVSAVSNTRIITEAQSDTTAPAIVSSDPADSDAGVSVDASVFVNFDEALDPTTVTTSSVQLLDSSDVPVDADVSLANGDTTVVIAPWTSLDYLSDYHISVAGTVADLSGNTVTADSSFATFTTEDVPADAEAPVITNIRTVAPIGTDSVTITWDTDEDSDSTVEYGTDSSYGTLTTTEDTPVSIDGVTSHSVTITGLSADTVYHFRVISADANSNSATSADNVFQTDVDDSTASLAVTGIDAVDTFADDTDDFGNGWSWTFYVTVPTNEQEFAMKFADFTSGANTILAASNIRYYTAQSTEADTTGEAVTIAGASTYPGNITLDGDLDAGTAGRQIAVTVEMKVPVGSAGGSYSAQYGVRSDAGI